jgi:uncharacterized alpha/beta hydrolase family protein
MKKDIDVDTDTTATTMSMSMKHVIGYLRSTYSITYMNIYRHGH